MAHSVTTGLWSVHTGPLTFSNFISTPFRFWILPTVREWHSMPPTLRDIFHHPVTTWQLSVPHHHSKPHYHNSFFHRRLHIFSLSLSLSLSAPTPANFTAVFSEFPSRCGHKGTGVRTQCQSCVIWNWTLLHQHICTTFQYLRNVEHQLLAQRFYLFLLHRQVSASVLCHLQGARKFFDVCSCCVNFCGRDST